MIEHPMIKEYSTVPTGMTIETYQSLTTWTTKGKKVQPFPLKKLVTGGQIKIDAAFKVDKLFVTPVEIPCLTSTGEIQCLGQKSPKDGGPSNYVPKTESE